MAVSYRLKDGITLRTDAHGIGCILDIYTVKNLTRFRDQRGAYVIA
jgi:hypothetical protein